MKNKRFLKQFASQADYDAQKDSVMGFPHVVLLEDTKGLVYKPKTGGMDYSKEYFTIVNTGEDTLNISVEGVTTWECNLNNSNSWVNGAMEIVSLEPGENVKVKCTLTEGENFYFMFNGETTCDVQGNIMSLIYGDDFVGKTDLTGYDYAFESLFDSCYQIVNTNNLILPATTLAYGCYSNMFAGCTSLTTAPALPATALAEECYNGMFYGTNVLPDCSNIDFSNEEVVTSCGLNGLFAGTKVTDADLERILPKNSEGKYCLPATTLANNCYNSMFQDCSSLTTAPELPATTLAEGCYNSMFYGCTSLTEAPELPATTLADYCYNRMFYGCTSLTEAPELPATTLTKYCYQSMFQDCSSLTEAPELPATTLTKYCYQSMFQDCSSLTVAPALPATTLASSCYQYMFQGCSSLNNITMLATDISAGKCLYNWVDKVSSSGTFVKSPSMTSLSRGKNGIPTGWSVEDYVNT